MWLARHLGGAATLPGGRTCNLWARPFCLSHLRCQTCPCRAGMGPLFHPYSAAPDQPCRTGVFVPVVTARRSFQVAPLRTGTFPHQAQRYKERKSSPRAVQGRADGGGSIILRVGPNLVKGLLSGAVSSRVRVGPCRIMMGHSRRRREVFTLRLLTISDMGHSKRRGEDAHAIGPACAGRGGGVLGARWE